VLNALNSRASVNEVTEKAAVAAFLYFVESIRIWLCRAEKINRRGSFYRELSHSSCH
jgi:hypothetical protein